MGCSLLSLLYSCKSCCCSAVPSPTVWSCCDDALPLSLGLPLPDFHQAVVQSSRDLSLDSLEHGFHRHLGEELRLLWMGGRLDIRGN